MAQDHPQEHVRSEEHHLNVALQRAGGRGLYKEAIIISSPCAHTQHFGLLLSVNSLIWQSNERRT